MTRKYFGTDGIRGTANRAPMTPDIALRVGLAAGRQFTRGAHRQRVVIGKDTRLSGYMIESALTSGFVLDFLENHAGDRVLLVIGQHGYTVDGEFKLPCHNDKLAPGGVLIHCATIVGAIARRRRASP